MKKGTVSKFLENKSPEEITKAVAAELMCAEAISIEQYQDIVEQANEDASKREHAYVVIAENLWNAAQQALEEGNLAESIAIGEVYNSWVDVCVKKGVL